MSSFSGWAVVDLKDGRDAEGFVKVLGEVVEGACTVLVAGRRVFVYADFEPLLYSEIGALMPEWGSRAVVAGDFDEHGVVNEVLGADGTAVHTASIGEQAGALPHNDTPEARRAAARLFGVDAGALDEVSATWAAEGAMPSVLGEPYLRWWKALGVPWPDDFGQRAVERG
ncbi:hypothetical protein Acsp04_14380 [Actinomadura sp. NBRC 104425]|uniref:hypothetical protein n=1 Tax=Actinomadura sp. NBRC 104425 TaxID=3032204 RepID=UPI0024A49934|nr:hypothetical protein [Actinomadura sp. NBRC 104425]GLZ11203.1 hypothetical protein Acsp04_14380 [Actinomadura sp. NBRC 104425]